MLRGFISRYAAADGGGSGAGDEDDPEERVRSEDIISRSANAQDTIARLGRELDRNEDRRFKQRAAKRALQAEIDDLKSKQPADGGRVLSKDEAAVYDAYVALGKPADAIKQALDASDAATQKLTKLERDGQIRDAALAHGYSAQALGKLPSLANVALTLKDETVEDKPIKRAYVTADGKEAALDAYILEHDPEFLPSLTVQSAPPPPPAPAARGTSFVQQHAGGVPAGDKADQFIKQQAEARAKQVNPLMKQGA